MRFTGFLGADHPKGQRDVYQLNVFDALTPFLQKHPYILSSNPAASRIYPYRVKPSLVFGCHHSTAGFILARGLTLNMIPGGGLLLVTTGGRYACLCC